MRNTKLILLAALICVPAITRAVTTITSLPYRIASPGQYVLGSNLTANGTDGIDVDAQNVSIDLAGYTLTQEQASGESKGISVAAEMTNVSIKNGVIIGFFKGVSIDGGHGHTVKNLRLIYNGDGIDTWARDSLIENCTIVGFDNQTGAGIFILQGSALRIEGNQISKYADGIASWYDPTATAVLIGNYEANCYNGLDLQSISVKYQRNVTTNCVKPVIAGIAIGKENG